VGRGGGGGGVRGGGSDNTDWTLNIKRKVHGQIKVSNYMPIPSKK